MADEQTADITQQVTTQIPATKPEKDPKKVAAGKAAADKARQAREAQKKKLAEADAIIAKEQLRKAEEEARNVIEAPVAESQNLTTTQWLSIASIIVSLAAIYYKREELKGVIAKIKAPQAKAPAPMAVANAPVLTAPKKKVLQYMD